MKKLLSIVESGGYPHFNHLYQAKGYVVTEMFTMRNALKWLKRNNASVIVAEFNFQSDFRDRSSSLESLLATVQWMPDVSVIVFFDREWQEKLNKLLEIHSVYETLSFPVDEALLSETLERAVVDS